MPGNTEDGDVGRFLRLFTELPIAEIERLENLEGQAINDAKKVLADEATRMCHGADAAQAVAAARTAPGQVATLILPSDTAWNDGGRVHGPVAPPALGEMDADALERAIKIGRASCRERV